METKKTVWKCSKDSVLVLHTLQSKKPQQSRDVGTKTQVRGTCTQGTPHPTGGYPGVGYLDGVTRRGYHRLNQARMSPWMVYFMPPEWYLEASRGGTRVYPL